MKNIDDINIIKYDSNNSIKLFLVTGCLLFCIYITITTTTTTTTIPCILVVYEKLNREEADKIEWRFLFVVLLLKMSDWRLRETLTNKHLE